MTLMFLIFLLFPVTIELHSLLLFRGKTARLEKMNTARRYIEEFQKEQALWRKESGRRWKEENRKIIEFMIAATKRRKIEWQKFKKVKKRLQLQNTVLK